jgi:hypothetical protein
MTPATDREPLYLWEVLPTIRATSRVTSESITPPSSLLRAHAPDHDPPTFLGLPPSVGLCRLSQVPAGTWPFPALSPRIFPQMLGPIPRWFLWCTRPLLPRGHRPSPCRDRLGSPQQSVQRLPYGRFNGAAVIRSCSGLRVCSPPRSLPPQYPMALGSRGLYVRAYDGSLPPRPSDMLAVRIGQLTAWGLPPHKIRGLAGRSPDPLPQALRHVRSFPTLRLLWPI